MSTKHSGSRPASVRQLQKAETRAALMNAARTLFDARGWTAVQVSDLAQAAGVAHGTVYVHFPGGKAEVMDLLLDGFNRDLVASLQVVWTPAALADPMALGRAVAATCIDAWAAQRGLVLAAAERAGADGSIAALRDGINPPVAAFLAERLTLLANVSGVVLPEAEAVAHALLGLWTRIALRHLAGGLSRDAAIDVLARMSIGALSAWFPFLQAPRGES